MEGRDDHDVERGTCGREPGRGRETAGLQQRGERVTCGQNETEHRTDVKPKVKEENETRNQE